MEYIYKGKLATYTEKDIETIKASGHSVSVYPRRKVAVIDGYKKYKMIAVEE